MKGHTLYFVAGVPGSGKTTVVKKLLEEGSGFVFFDIDWLADPVSALVGRDIRFAPETWPAYGEVWFSVLHAVIKNGLTPVLLTPADPSDFASGPLPDWCAGISWLLLDCDDETRLERLRRRGWEEERLQDALHDARVLRALVSQRVDTGSLAPAEVAALVLTWLRGQRGQRGQLRE